VRNVLVYVDTVLTTVTPSLELAPMDARMDTKVMAVQKVNILNDEIPLR
jgi:hypothetical protein